MSEPPPSLLFDEFYSTFVASIRSVGTACTLAGVGIYLHRRNFISSTGKRTLALISQQVTIPLFLFTKVIHCNQDWSTDPCPDIASSLRDVWVLLLWPAVVVACGVCIGYLAASSSKTPQYQLKSVLAACAFGNSTGLPITLLTVVHANFKNTELGVVDPTLFLSVYLLLYPVLQWGVGGWLLAPEDDADSVAADKEESNDKTDVEDSAAPQVSSSRQPVRRHVRRGSSSGLGGNVLNNKQMADLYKTSRRGISETDASLYMSNVDLVELGRQHTSESTLPHPLTGGGQVHLDGISNAATSLDQHPELSATAHVDEQILIGSNETESLLYFPAAMESPDRTAAEEDSNDTSDPSFWDTVQEILSRCLQPPALGALMGLLIAVTPVRGIFVDVKDRDDDAPLQWFFDGLYEVGQAAVPINMIILGCNLSTSQFRPKAGKQAANLFSRRTMVAIVVAKMLVLPIVGIMLVVSLKTYVLHVPDDIEASFYLVAMIVFITPTANNVMVMVELSGNGSKAGIAQVIAWQYAVAPVLLSLTMTVVVWVARQ